MKKVEKVSIADISFTLDSDAYVSIKQYLDSLNRCYDKNPDGREIIADIEARIAELILSEQIYTKIVSRSLIDTIIAQLGTPQEIDDEAGERFASGSAAETPSGGGFTGAGWGLGSGGESGIPRRLHRSDEGKILGGVCSGFAKYFDFNVAWIRVLFLLPLLLRLIIEPFHFWKLDHIFGGWIWVFFVIYVVLWIALPMAKTPRQKLEARGEKITAESIRQHMQGSVNTPAGKKAASVAAELVTVLGRALLFIVKFVTAVTGFSLLFAAVGILMTMVLVFFHPTTVVAGNVGIVTMFEGMGTPVLFVLLTMLCVMMPLFVIGMALLGFTFGWRLGRLFYGFTLGLWALAIIFCGLVTIKEVRFFRDVFPSRIERLYDHGHWEHHHNYDRDGEWRSEPGRRAKIRDIRDSLDASDSLDNGAAAGLDSLSTDAPALISPSL